MSYTLTQTQNFCEGFLQGQPTSAWSGGEPFLSTASGVLATMLQPPFAWGFNRNSYSFAATTGQQDYPQTLTDFGYLESGSVYDQTTYFEVKDVKNNQPLSVSNTKARPMTISVQTWVPGTSQSFRLSAVPDQNYTVAINYQKLPVLFTSLSNNWSPLPDPYVVQIANFGVLAELLNYADDPRYVQYRQRFVGGLLAISEGLTEEDKAVFAQGYIQQGVSFVMPQARAQQAQQARSI